jgi:hypothetical protein
MRKGVKGSVKELSSKINSLENRIKELGNKIDIKKYIKNKYIK